jgi:hypothetical protein
MTRRTLTTPITAEQRNQIKKIVLRCLTEDFEYGRTKAGTPRKKPYRNQAIFSRQSGRQCFNGTDLDMIMGKVVLALSFAMDTEATDDRP